MRQLRPLEIFLIQFIFYTILWLMNDYVASLITIIFVPICFFILLVSLITELIERSKVPRAYFTFMIISVITPIVAALIFVGVAGMDFEWLK